MNYVALHYEPSTNLRPAGGAVAEPPGRCRRCRDRDRADDERRRLRRVRIGHAPPGRIRLAAAALLHAAARLFCRRPVLAPPVRGRPTDRVRNCKAPNGALSMRLPEAGHQQQRSEMAGEAAGRGQGALRSRQRSRAAAGLCAEGDGHQLSRRRPRRWRAVHQPGAEGRLSQGGLRAGFAGSAGSPQRSPGTPGRLCASAFRNILLPSVDVPFRLSRKSI
jgi:hypothetical protein